MSSPSSPVVLVTGAAKRLGRAIALALAGRGWRVAVHYHQSTEDAIKTVADCALQTSGAAAFQADLSQSRQTEQLASAVLQKMQRLDAVVHSASLFAFDSPDSFSEDLLVRHQQVNTAAALLLARALHRHLAERDSRGALVALLDQKLWNLNPDFFSYTLSKAALQAAIPMLAQHYAPRLRVVGVAPGLTLPSPMLSAERFAQLHAQAPLGRASEPADVAHAVVFALENRALTGSSLIVDGGQHMQRFARDFSLM